MPPLEITIHDDPIGKGRPRFSPKQGRAFTPTKTRQWEARAAAAVADALPDGWRAMEQAKLQITAVFRRPESMKCKHKRACQCEESGRLGRQRHVKAPDCDNIAKAVCDALEKGGAIVNDRGIWLLIVMKYVAAEGEAPAVYLLLEET